MKKINFKILIACLVFVYLIAFIGSLFTFSNTDSEWYLNNKSSITPPNYVFPIVWNILFLLIAFSLYFAWINSNKKQKRKVAWIFGTNLALNALWSFLFFALKQPLLAFVDLLFILATIIWMIYVVYPIDKKAGWLLVPYLAWVMFAGVLNWLWLR
ncbi:MAG: tryptophan-rich sensory protein [Nanoarchaeota archaeon]|nr:tryptophan-rich sensory protein [Nanoarchaeota archaeon]MBU4116772.1 tryptophan-rich sensory protein [Nanoarchaeota archaeon]